jgi:hypothetical protein
MSTLLSNDWKKILFTCYGVNSSNEFFKCADNQLSSIFESETNLKITPEIWMQLDHENQFIYKKDDISVIESRILLKYGILKVNFLWNSKSGRIYAISDSDIDCTDITFWFEELNPAQCNSFMNPKWSLITFPVTLIEMFKNQSNLTVSEEFVATADAQLTPLFEKTVGYKVNKHVSISTIGKDDTRFVYEKGPISKLSINIYNNHNWNFVLIHWQSKSGRVYDVGDTDIDNNDIEFWIEGIDVAMYNQQMYPKATLPFKLKDLSYELVVTRLNTDCTFTAIVKPEAANNREVIGKALTDFIESFNLASEAKDRKDGVVHSAKVTMQGENILLLEMDMGSAGAAFVKKLLNSISAHNYFTKVEIG